MVKLTSGHRNLTKGRIAVPHMDDIPYTLQWVVPPPLLEFACFDEDVDPQSRPPQ